MTYDEIPEWMLSAMREADAQMRAAQPYVEQAQWGAAAVRIIMSALRDAEEYAEQARQVLEMVRSTWPIVEQIQRQTAQMRQALASAGLLLVYADRVVLAMDAGPRHHAASASLTVTPTFTVHAEVVKAADSKDVDAQPDARPDTRRSIDLAALGVKLVMAWALIFPIVQALLPTADQEILGCYIATIALTLTVAWRYDDTHKH